MTATDEILLSRLTLIGTGSSFLCEASPPCEKVWSDHVMADWQPYIVAKLMVKFFF
jgi:hypothetical protein